MPRRSGRWRADMHGSVTNSGRDPSILNSACRRHTLAAN
jgi:hypothetical protein